MKKIFILLLLLSSIAAFASDTPDSTRIKLNQARGMASASSPRDLQQRAFALYTKLAQQGNAEAMNGLAMLYSKGIGTTVDDQQAKSWFNKAAQNGYADAWYNLALIYKDGVGGEPQDFTKAYACYQKGADLNNAMCVYGQGYLLYKGFGVSQSYEKAVVLFKRGLTMANEGSLFMLGLCYRNGYGTTANTDSAKYFLKRAAAKGDQRAVRELADASPENADLKNVPDLQPPPSTGTQPVNLKSGFRQIEHHLSAGVVTGTYNGFIIKFDWSGKHVISQSGLKLHLTQNNQILSGEWQEEGQEAATFSGTLADTALVFNNNTYHQLDHYHRVKPLNTEFKDSHLNFVKNKDTLYLTGTVRLYSPETKEPQRPEFMMLVRTASTDQQLAGHADSIRNDSLHFVAYPNPFGDRVQLRYTLKKQARVSVMVSNLLSGIVVYRSNAEELSPGDYTRNVAFNGQPGNYVVTLQYNKKVKSAIIIKR